MDKLIQIVGVFFIFITLASPFVALVLYTHGLISSAVMSLLLTVIGGYSSFRTVQYVSERKGL